MTKEVHIDYSRALTNLAPPPRAEADREPGAFLRSGQPEGRCAKDALVMFYQDPHEKIEGLNGMEMLTRWGWRIWR